MALGNNQEQVFLGYDIAQRREYSESTAQEVDQAVKQILDDCYERACEILRSRQKPLDRLARLLIEKEEIPGKEVLELLHSSDG